MAEKSFMIKRFVVSPSALFALLSLVLFIAFQSYQTAQMQAIKQLPPVPKDKRVFDFHFSEPLLLSRFLMFWLQTFDSQSGRIIQYDQLNYDDLINWLMLIRRLDPDSQYALLTATHLFTETKSKAKIRQMLQFIENSFMVSPEIFWRWQAYAVVLAKHRLGDMAYALKLSQNLNKMTKNSQIDAWARDMEFLILEDMGEFEASALMIKGLLDSGTITETRELNFLTQKLKALKKPE